jgi:uncharacterized membrane protein YcaP (DUF421 family)
VNPAAAADNPGMIEALLGLLGDPVTVLFTLLRVLLTYAALLGLIHLMGQRTLGQMTSFDLVTLLLISNAVQNAMTGPDHSLLGGLLGAVMLLAANLVVAKNTALRSKLESDPVLLAFNGRLFAGAMKRYNITRADVEAAAREHGLANLSGVHMAVLEMDGKISIVPVAAP